jgi:hypothetical protein
MLLGFSRKGLARKGLARKGLARKGLARKGLARKGLARKGLARKGPHCRKACFCTTRQTMLSKGKAQHHATAV